MSDPLFTTQKQYLQETYGVQFPDDFFHFWQFVNEVNPSNPCELPCNLYLVGAFDVFSGRFEEQGLPTALSIRMHWRFYKDPPEFFTVLGGGADGLHYGYYYDDPNTLPTCVCEYFHNDAYDPGNAGATLFDAVQGNIKNYLRSLDEWVQQEEYDPEEAEEEAEPLQEFLTQMQDYRDRHSIPSPPERQKTAETWDRMGIIVPSETYRPLTQTRKADKLIEARAALEEGFPGTALKFAKDLWYLQDPEWTREAIALMQAAYPALNRALLAEILQEHANACDPGLNYLDFLNPLISIDSVVED